MFGLHWFHGITMNTKVSSIGWFYVLVVFLLSVVIFCLVNLIRDWNR